MRSRNSGDISYFGPVSQQAELIGEGPGVGYCISTCPRTSGIERHRLYSDPADGELTFMSEDHSRPLTQEPVGFLPSPTNGKRVSGQASILELLPILAKVRGL